MFQMLDLDEHEEERDDDRDRREHAQLQDLERQLSPAGSEPGDAVGGEDADEQREDRAGRRRR